jgi:hypothetical protein
MGDFLLPRVAPIFSLKGRDSLWSVAGGIPCARTSMKKGSDSGAFVTNPNQSISILLTCCYLQCNIPSDETSCWQSEKTGYLGEDRTQREQIHISDPAKHIRVSQRSPTIAIQTETLADNTGERITAAYGIQLRVQDFLLQRLNRQEFKLSLPSDTLQTANSTKKRSTNNRRT